MNKNKGIIFANSMDIYSDNLLKILKILSPRGVDRDKDSSLPFFHAILQHQNTRTWVVAKDTGSASIKEFIPKIKLVAPNVGIDLLIFHVNVSYRVHGGRMARVPPNLGAFKTGERVEKWIPEERGWLGVDAALPDHKLLLDEFLDIPYFVLVTGNNKPKAMTEDFLRKRWREISDVEDFPIIPYAGNENFREEFLKTVETMVDKILQKPD